MGEETHSLDSTEIVADAERIADQLLQEGGRGAVLLGAARLELALENLLKAVLLPSAGGDDSLFDNEKPLGTFSAKITMAHRLGLIDNHAEHALQMVRKVRNDFAHSFEDTSLAEQTHKNRLSKPYALAKQGVLWQVLAPALERDYRSKPKELRDFVCLVVVILVTARACLRNLKVLMPASKVVVPAQTPEAKPTPKPSIERTRPGKPGRASHVKR